MKTTYSKKLVAFLALASMALSVSTVLAQDSSATTTIQATPTPQLAYGVSQILQLAQAKVSDDTIITYIKNSGNSYGLTADQIIYLQQQGLSPAVINAMLSQPKPGVLAAASAPVATTTVTPAPVVAYDTQPSVSTMVTPPITGIDPTYSAAYSSYYYQPYYYPYYSYPYYYPAYGYYGCYPGVTVSLGWGRGWGGYGWRGGFHGGFHDGFHGGFGGGFHGGFHR